MMNGISSVLSCSYQRILKTYFKHTPSDLPTKVYSIHVSGNKVGYVCVEYQAGVGVIHLGMDPNYICREVLTMFPDLYHNNLVPLLKNLGLQLITTVCESDDAGTIRMMKSIGMDVKEMTHGIQPI